MDSYAKLGVGGVNLIEQDYHPGDGQVEEAQNADYVLDTEQSGEATLQKRSGYTPLGTVFASGVVEMVELRFISSL